MDPPTPPATVDSTPPPHFDYAAMLGEDNIHGLKQGYTSGNHVYYMGGIFLVQSMTETETVGLSHCFHNDLRSRGLGYVSDPQYPQMGIGNDYKGSLQARI